MTADTPTPYPPPEGVIRTTMAEARRVGGQVSSGIYADNWRDVEYWPTWPDAFFVWWRPTPERTVTIELPEPAVRWLEAEGWCDHSSRVVWLACREALDALDGDD